jgi:putative spermidine/putrescine transport system ATP-binding protein
MHARDIKKSSAMTAGEGSQRSTAVFIDDVGKSFGLAQVLSGCTLQVEAGSFVTLLGASGSGKTTLLRIIAGFLEADRGSVFFNGKSMTGVPPHRRNIRMVFQSYALFPHLSVFDNVAYPLRMRRLGNIEQRVAEALKSVRLEQFVARMPAALSGGQRQRVAMARALVANPPLLLLDEPLSALDKELREELQVEIKTIHRQAGTTFINVTHDQGEALGMSDVVVVMGNGRIQQADSPERLWNAPANAFVARFLGGSNLISATGAGGVYRLLGGDALSAGGAPVNGTVALAFRPETVSISTMVSDASEQNRLKGRVVETIFMGEAVRVVVAAEGQEISARMAPYRAAGLTPGLDVNIEWPIRSTLALPVEADG